MAFIKKEPLTPEVLKKYEEKFGVDALAIDLMVRFLITSSDAEKLFEKHLMTVNLTQGRFAAMMMLNNAPHRRAKPIDMADYLGVTRGNMTGILDNLERDGLIGRMDDDEDRRINYVFLTEKGIKLLAQFLPKHFDRVGWLLKVLDKKEKVLFKELLDKIRERIQTQIEFFEKPK